MTSLKSLFTEVTEIPEYFKREHFPSLNGFRAVSVIIVVIFHLTLSNSPLYQTVFNGSLGVDVFFVLSGFLITTLLLKEKAETGTISLRLFYIRRSLRILPAAYLCIIIVALLNYFFDLKINYLYLLAAAFFVVNFEFLAPLKTPLVSHYWSLSVEEQFYLIFPVIVKKNFKLFVVFILFIVFVLPLIFTMQYFIPQLNHGLLFAITHFFIKFQGIAVGCLFAVLCFKNLIKLKHNRYHIILKILLTIAIFSIVHTGSVNVFSVYTNLIISLLIGWLLMLNLFSVNDWFYKFLNNKYVAKIGVLSYSIYIWHLLILNLPGSPKFISDFPISILIIFLVAWISYNYWEKPFLKLKSRFAVIKDRV